ncbi:phage tail tape measure protein [Rhodococcus sp. SORGH_AS_0303]|uniref:phage tail tape measure protein n=1 Tax=Rhodococcus sp. SORGH_AS_0303 TaxID=3041753 RepID=UPI002788F549|nr:phage tail tape measure protein [Rhodococcus sp. SORGH_AS_0303]MDQ1201089.1 TP901 family phage tail tape measure protein [Rhodococcus sp. SORGH_AS_0303]
MAVEIASAYVSLSVSTANIPRQMRAAFANAAPEAERAGRDAGQRMGAGLQNSLGSSLKTLAGAAGLATGVAAIAAGFKQVISVGNDFTTSLNTMSAVSGATEAQLAAVSERARTLGNDISLPGTSAGDAAAAMTELAKGGFSVEQSMDAAKGTLQLAAAAQIDAASAATIQSQALQSFGLNADYAAKTSDVLANAANASSAEITDIANGLQQAGAVANQFGLTIEDTATGLALFANAGITGSDAGTLLKSALLALTDTSNPAQGAIEELGLTVYDAQGQFVGLSSLFGQLDDAAASMTPEMYQAATATLFGSDAMRLAGVAAQVGSEGFDSMQVAINRQGAAAEVAAAKTQGLPGAMAAVGNAAETAALQIYDLVDGPLEALAGKSADFISSNSPKFVDGLTEVGSAAGSTVSALSSIPTEVQAIGAGLLIGQLAARRYGSSLTTMGGNATSAATAMRQIATANNLAASAGSAGSVAMGRFGSSIAQLGTHRPAVAQMQTAFLGAASSAERFGRAAGTAAAAGQGMRLAASGVVGALGGPVGLGLTATAIGATVVMGNLAKSHREAAAEAEAQRAAVQSLQQSLEENTGAVTSETYQNKAQELAAGGQLDSAQDYGIQGRDYVAATLGFEAPLQRVNDLLQSNIDKSVQASGVFRNNIDVYSELGITADDLTAALSGNSAKYDEITSKVDTYNAAQTTGRNGVALTVAGLDDLKAGLDTAGQGAINLSNTVNTSNGQLTEAQQIQRDYASALVGTAGETQTLAGNVAVLGQTVIDVPNEKTVRIEAPTQEQRDRLLGLGLTIEQIPGSKDVVVRADTVDAENAVNAFVQKQRTAIITLQTVEKERVPAAVFPGGRAHGGRLPLTGPGTGVTDGILGVTGAGMPIARVDAGEWVINGNSSAKYDRELAAINAGTFPKLPGYAGGGVVDAMTALVQKRWPTMEMTSGYRDEPGSFHYTGQAGDFSNGSGDTPEMQELSNFIADNYMSATAELIHAPFDRNIDNGQSVGDGYAFFGSDTMGQHYNHVHWAMTTPPSEPATAAPTDTRSDRDRIVDDIVAEGRDRGISDRGITIALGAGLVESELQNLDYGPDSSTGVFQQQDNGAWGTAEERMTPRAAAGMFYDELSKLDYENMDPGAAAQAVQRSAYPDKYAPRMAEAEQLLAASTGRAVVVPPAPQDVVTAAEEAAPAVTEPAEPTSTTTPEKAPQPEVKTFSISDRFRQFGSEVGKIGAQALLDQLPFDLGSSRLLTMQLPDFSQQPGQVEGGTPPPDPKTWVPGMLETGQFPGPEATGLQQESPVVEYLRRFRESLNQVPVFDQGGWVKPGLNLVNNQTGGPELLRNATKEKPVPQPSLTADAMSQMLADRPNVQFNVTDIDEALRKYTQHQKQNALTFSRR